MALSLKARIDAGETVFAPLALDALTARIAVRAGFGAVYVSGGALGYAHGVSEALYFRDPDGNGIEIYCDRAEEDWPRDAEGNLQIVNTRIDVNALLAEAA